MAEVQQPTDEKTQQYDEKQVEDSLQGIPQRELTDKELQDLADVAMVYVQQMTGIELHPYQYEFGWRIIYSLLSEDSEEITSLFARQMGKCLAPDTPVLMHDGTRKRADEVEIGDSLMGDDSTPRIVQSLSHGELPMYRIVPNSNAADSYVVNSEHILSVKKRYDGSYVDLPIRRVKSLSSIESSYLGYQVPVEYPKKNLILDPYWLGLWLGDGTHRDVSITTEDSEVVTFLEELAASFGLTVSKYQSDEECPSYAIVNDGSLGGNPFRSGLKTLGLTWPAKKKIPFDYLTSCRTDRLLLLAGLLDSDGSSSQDNCIEITQKSRELADDLLVLCRSLGFRTTLRPKPVDGVDYYRVRLYGDIWNIPTKIERKKWVEKPLREDPLSYGFTITEEGVGKYCGFEVDGNHRFLLGDYTVTHNSEAVADVVVGAMVLLPVFARNIPWDARISKFDKGIWVGIYAPNYEQAGILWSRMKMRMYSNEARSALLDPDIDIDLDKATQNLVLPNGSFVDAGTASPQSSIEGKTYHLIILEECQDIPTNKIRESIHPMGAATAATLVKIGTPNRKRSEFFEACRRNKRMDLNEGVVRSKKRRHYEYDYTVGQKYNPRYRKYIKKELIRLGEDSDEFRMKYRLHWLLDRGMFINPDMFEDCGIKDNKSDLQVVLGKGRRKKTITFGRSPNVVTYDPGNDGIIAAIDVGRTNSTVVTVGKVFWESPAQYADSDRFPLHVLNWLELQGDDHEAQHPQIIDFLKNFNLSQAIIDATGKGDPVYSRIAAELDEYGVRVQPFIFNANTKDIGYKTFSQELSARRFTFPAGHRATRLQKWQRFVTQMQDLEKEWRGQQLLVHKPKHSSDARDDYCLSDDMEILTRDGWKTIDTISDEDFVCAYRRETGTLCHEKPLRIIKRELHSGEGMLQIVGDTVDQVVTTTHKTLFQRNLRGTDWVQESLPAKELLRRNPDKNRLYVSGKQQGETVSYTEDEVSLAGWMITEGWTRKSHPNGTTRYEIAQSATKNQKFTEELTGLLDRLNISHNVYDRKDGVRYFQCRVSETEFFDWLLPEGLRRIPRKMLSGLSSKAARSLLVALLKGDGDFLSDRTTKTFFTTDSGLAEDVHELAFKCGIRSRIIPRDGGYYVYLHQTVFGYPKTIREVPYSGRVWCVTVPSGYLVTRRNRKMSITGNCDSAMMLCWLANVQATTEMEEAPNPFLGRQSRWAGADMIKDMRAWYRKATDPRPRRKTRPSKSGKWD